MVPICQYNARDCEGVTLQWHMTGVDQYKFYSIIKCQKSKQVGKEWNYYKFNKNEARFSVIIRARNFTKYIYNHYFKYYNNIKHTGGTTVTPRRFVPCDPCIAQIYPRY